MWPWEHLAVGYVLFSLACRGLRSVRPGDGSAVLLALSTQAPDLVDKPLAWGLGVLPSGQSLGHSVFVAIPVALLAVVLGRGRRHPTAGVAIAVGYLSHLLSDVVYPVLRGDALDWAAVLWPLVEVTPDPQVRLAERLQALLTRLVDGLSPGDLVLYVGFEVILLSAAFGLWVADGRPGLRYLSAALGRRDRTP